MEEDNQWVGLLGQLENLKSKYTGNNGVRKQKPCSQ